MKYEFLLFDADHTLFDFKKSEYFALKEALEFYSLPSGDDVIERYSIINVKYWKMLERGEIEKSALMLARFVEFAREYGFEDKAEALSDLYMSNLAHEAHLFDGALEAKGFYEKLGFEVVSEEFELAGVPHIAMELRIPA